MSKRSADSSSRSRSLSLESRSSRSKSRSNNSVKSNSVEKFSKNNFKMTPSPPNRKYSKSNSSVDNSIQEPRNTGNISDARNGSTEIKERSRSGFNKPTTGKLCRSISNHSDSEDFSKKSNANKRKSTRSNSSRNAEEHEAKIDSKNHRNKHKSRSVSSKRCNRREDKYHQSRSISPRNESSYRPRDLSNKNNRRRSRSNKEQSNHKYRTKSRSNSIKNNRRRRSRSLSKKYDRRRRSRSNSYRNERRVRRNYSRSRSPYPSHRYNRNKKDNSDPCSCIGVFGLSQKTREDTLWDYFSKYGKIKTLKLIKNSYAFIDFRDIESAIDAMRDKNDINIDDTMVRLDYSNKKKAQQSRSSYENSSRLDSRYRDRRDVYKKRSVSRSPRRSNRSRS